MISAEFAILSVGYNPARENAGGIFEKAACIEQAKAMAQKIFRGRMFHVELSRANFCAGVYKRAKRGYNIVRNKE